MRGWITDPNEAEGVKLAVDLPEPTPGPEDVVVDVKAYSINRGELPLIKERPKDFRPGQDVAGVIVKTVRNGPAVGTRVVGIVDWHGWAERVSVHHAHVAMLPELVSFVDAATLPVSGLTALRAVRAGGSVIGKRVLVIGATGGVGQIATPLAVAGGAHVTALVNDARHFEHARELGAHIAISSLGMDDGPFDVVIDGVGGPTLVEAIHRLAPHGTAVMFGVLAGKSSIDIFDFARAPYSKLVALFLTEPGATAGEELGALVRLVADRRIRPVVSLTLDWSKTADALLAMRERRVRGKAVLTRT
jgi:NADPH2:quinone reductase